MAVLQIEQLHAKDNVDCTFYSLRDLPKKKDKSTKAKNAEKHCQSRKEGHLMILGIITSI